MLWEELTRSGFEEAVRRSEGVCLLPLGVIEDHGAHLPLGTDMIRAHRLAADVAAVEPALVFPALFLTLNTECKIYPGGIVARADLLSPMLENVCDEIARNGVRKIVLFSGHGGNRFFLPFFVQTMLDKGKDFVPYLVSGFEDMELHNTIFESTVHGHGDERETSELLYLRPDLVDLEAAGDRVWPREDRLSHVPHTYTPVDWFARQPDMVCGEPGPATAEKGKVFWEDQVSRLATIVKAVKEDRTAEELYAEFGSRADVSRVP